MFDKNKTYSFKPISQHIESMGDDVCFKPLSISKVRELADKQDDGLDIACWTLFETVVDENGKQVFDSESEAKEYFQNFPTTVIKELVEKANEASGLVQKKD